MSKSIKDYSIEELKAIAYDNIKQIEILRANVSSIEAELSSRSNNNGALKKNSDEKEKAK
jgi:hypothetical protein